MQAAKRDMAFLAVIGSGNDYVPCIHPSTERMWPAYLKLRQQDQWHDRQEHRPRDTVCRHCISTHAAHMASALAGLMTACSGMLL